MLRSLVGSEMCIRDSQYLDPTPMLVYSLEYDLPLVEKSNIKLSNYAELAVIDGYGKGLIFPGFSLRWLIFDTKLELRNFGSRFLPAYFNNLYDEQRCEVVDLSAVSENGRRIYSLTVSYTHLRAHETPEHLVCRLLLEKKQHSTHPSAPFTPLHPEYRYTPPHTPSS